MKKEVSVVGCDNYNQKEVDNAIRKSLKQIGFKINPKSRILIKPNLVSPNTPEQHSITHYTFVDSLCRYFLEKDCEITIGESSAFYIKGYTKSAYHTSKIYDIAQKYSIPLIAFEDEKIISIPKKNLKFLKSFYLPKIINDFDLIVDVPKIKTHALMRFTGAVKNLYGIVPGGYKQILHLETKNINDMAEIFLDLYENLKPKILSVADAVIGLDGGPSATGKPRKIGYVFASINPIALDIVACQAIGYSPKDIPTITMAEKRNLINLNDIKQIGKFNKIKFEKLQKGPILDIKKKSLFVTKTYAIPKANYKCIHCGKCVLNCPVNAISIQGKKWVLDKEKCISCYSCVPVCPVRAINLKDKFINKFFNFVRRIFKL